MRADAVGPRTWMLGAVTVWALLAWILALSGLGRRVGPLPDDSSLSAELPQWRTPAAERLAPLSQYAATGERPLFDEERRPRPFFIEGAGNGEAASASDLVLTGVLIMPGMQVAILQQGEGGPSMRLKPGEANEALPGWRLVELAPRSAVLDGPQGRRTLELRAYVGTGGEPPTATAPASAAAAAAQNPTPPAPAAAPVTLPKPAVEPPAMTSEQQMQAIRQRIEARRRQLREQQQREQAEQAKP